MWTPVLFVSEHGDGSACSYFTHLLQSSITYDQELWVEMNCPYEQLWVAQLSFPRSWKEDPKFAEELRRFGHLIRTSLSEKLTQDWLEEEERWTVFCFAPIACFCPTELPSSYSDHDLSVRNKFIQGPKFTIKQLGGVLATELCESAATQQQQTWLHTAVVCLEDSYSGDIAPAC